MYFNWRANPIMLSVFLLYVNRADFNAEWEDLWN